MQYHPGRRTPHEPDTWVRPGSLADSASVLTLNHASVPHVNPIDPAFLKRALRAGASLDLVGCSREAVGFVLGWREGADYQSPNYQWFAARYDRFCYVDRIAIDPLHRGRGLGTLLYAHLIRRERSSVSHITCEVNTYPPNPGSLAFHRRIGFREVGRQATEGGTKQVALLHLALTS